MRFPSVNKIMAIGLTKEQATEVRKRLEEGYAGIVADTVFDPVDAALNYADDFLQRLGKSHGVEYIRHKDDSQHQVYGVSYLNVGEAYYPTILFDHARGTFSIGAWGDMMERAKEGTYL
jgi:hypothetical protein